MWNLWMMRNKMIFNNGVGHTESVVHGIKIPSWSWFVSSLKVKFGLLFVVQ